MNNVPLVSVITSNYNCARHLPDCVSSVLDQTFDSWEHIIIDCGSTDNSRQVLESLKHPRLRVVHESFCGVARARNIAIQQAQGEFCAILDADDMALPDRLCLQVELLRKNPELAAVGGDIQAIYFWERMWKRILRRNNRTFQYPYRHDEIMLFLRSVLSPIPHSTLTFRKTIFQEIGGYREAMEKAEDYDLILRFSLHGRLAGVRELVSILRFGVVDSHSTRHRPHGRDAMYYAVLALLFNIACANGLKCAQQDIEKWLDGIGKQGISALQGRWGWKNFMKRSKCLPLASRIIILKALILHLPATVACRNRPWWSAARSPETILKEYIIPGRKEDEG
jgi:glycosyltransferase involved in cell wall biosynthesis